MRKFKVGDIVTLKEGLKVGARYKSMCKSYGDVFTHSMRNNLGKEAKVVTFQGGGYVLAFNGKTDNVHIYYDDMIEKIKVVDYYFNPEVEELVQHMEKQFIQKEIDKALDEKDEQKFNELVSKYKSLV
jgi:IDEAL domain